MAIGRSPYELEAQKRSGEMQRLRLKAAKQQMPSFREEVFARRYPGGAEEGPMVAAGVPETVRTRRETPGGLAGARALATEAPGPLDYATPVKTARGTWQWRPQTYAVRGERWPLAGAGERIGRMERDIADIRGQRREAAGLELARRGIETQYGTQGWRGIEPTALYRPGGLAEQQMASRERIAQITASGQERFTPRDIMGIRAKGLDYADKKMFDDPQMRAEIKANPTQADAIQNKYRQRFMQEYFQIVAGGEQQAPSFRQQVLERTRPPLGEGRSVRTTPIQPSALGGMEIQETGGGYGRAWFPGTEVTKPPTAKEPKKTKQPTWEDIEKLMMQQR